MAISQHKSESVGVLLETLGYGIYLAVFYQCVVVLRQRKLKSIRTTSYLFWTAVLLFICVTMHLVVDIVRDMEAEALGSPALAEKYYDDLGTWKNVFKTAAYTVATDISDAFLLYRCYIVWSRNIYVIIIPALLFLGDVAMGLQFCIVLSRTKVGQGFTTVRPALQFYSVTLACNAVSTLLIAFRIWKIQRSVAVYVTLDNEMKRVISMIVESGAIYSLWQVVLIATFAAGTPAMFICLNSLSPVIGIVFSSLIVRIGLGLSAGDSHQQISGVSASRLTNSRVLASSFPEGVQISLQKTVQTHRDGDDMLEEGSYGRVKEAYSEAV